MSKTYSKTRTLVECALMIALGTVLANIKIFEMPNGGSITLLSMLPFILISFRHGVKWGLFTGFVNSLLQMLLGFYAPPAPGLLPLVGMILLDYVLAFTLLGLGGCFRNIRFSKNDTTNLIVAALLGTLLVTLLRFACHIVSGAVIWYALDLEWYADDPTHIVHKYGAWMFSVIYNGTFMLPEIVETVIGVPLLTKALSKVNMKH